MKTKIQKYEHSSDEQSKYEKMHLRSSFDCSNVRLFVILLFVFFCQLPVAHCQSSMIDSLKKVLLTAKKDTNRVNALNNLSKQLWQKGNYGTAFFYAKEAKQLAAKAESDKQQAVAEAESKKQKIVIWSVIAVLLLVVVFAIFIFRALRITQKQKKVIELQKKIVEEKQKEILDSIRYARRIQTALLPTEKYIRPLA